MAKRQPRTSVCSGCLEEFLDKEMYMVEKYMNRSNPNPKNTYYTPYCKKCIKDSNSYYRVHQEPIIK
jgi:hypothetical protein